MNKQLSDYVVGDWIPDLRKFKHQCPICGKEFFAKKDAKYCGQGCKSRVAIDKASEIRMKTKGFTDKLKNNFLILEQYYPFSKGIEWIVDNVLTEEQLYSMYNNLMKYAYHFGQDRGDSYDRILKGEPSKNPLVQEYFDNCDFVGVSSPSRGGSPENPEKAKEEALLLFQDKINDYAQKIGMKAKIGFSDDDLKNVKHIEDLYDNLHKERFPNIIQFSVKGTKDPKNITKKVRTMESKLNETSQQAPGTESSVLKFTQFGNMAAQLNPQGPDQRQDDFANQFKRQTKYLAKTSKDILGNKKRKKKD